MAQLMRSQLETYPNQLRRLIAGAVLAFGFDQGLLLRRQRAVACWRLVTIQEYEPVPSVTNCKRARAQLSLSAGKTPVSSLILSTLSLLTLATNHPALSSRSSGPHQPIIKPLAADQQTATNHPDS